MKRTKIIKHMQMFASMAFLITSVVANSACIFIAHQEKMPEKAKKLRKF